MPEIKYKLRLSTYYFNVSTLNYTVRTVRERRDNKKRSQGTLPILLPDQPTNYLWL
jgi:hypothetical protein